MGINATVVPKSGQPNGRQLFLQGSPWVNLSDTFKFGCLEQTYTKPRVFASGVISRSLAFMKSKVKLAFRGLVVARYTSFPVVV